MLREEAQGSTGSSPSDDGAASVETTAARTHLNPAGRWYVVHTQPHREGRAQSHLVGQGFRIFLPRFSKSVWHVSSPKSEHRLKPCQNL